MGPSAVDSNELKAVMNRQKKTAVRLLRGIKNVGLSDKDVKMLKKLIDHEDKEFAFTLSRIEQLQS
jgi:rubrerythrin